MTQNTAREQTRRQRTRNLDADIRSARLDLSNYQRRYESARNGIERARERLNALLALKGGDDE